MGCVVLADLMVYPAGVHLDGGVVDVVHVYNNVLGELLLARAARPPARARLLLHLAPLPLPLTVGGLHSVQLCNRHHC